MYLLGVAGQAWAGGEGALEDLRAAEALLSCSKCTQWFPDLLAHLSPPEPPGERD